MLCHTAFSLILKQLIEAETKRQIKKEPALAMELVKNPFPLGSDDDAEVVAESGLDIVSELWVFG